MVKKQTTQAELKELIKQENLLIGTERIIKNLKNGNISKVYVSSNCPDSVKKDVEHYCKMQDVEVVQLRQMNDELGVICKKPYAISMLALLKGE